MAVQVLRLLRKLLFEWFCEAFSWPLALKAGGLPWFSAQLLTFSLG
jgi:hypothetical protein